MIVMVNGEETSLTDDESVRSLLDSRNQEGRVAVAVNGEFVPRGSYGEVFLSEGDEVEIVAPMQGG